MQITLWKRNLGAGVLERAVDGTEQVVGGVEAMIDLADVGTQFEIQRAIAEVDEQSPRLSVSRIRRAQWRGDARRACCQ